MAHSLRQLQEAFAAHIRDPEHVDGPSDVEDRRMAIYRDLFFRNLSNFIARSFPVLRQLYSEDDWSRFMREFYVEHACHTPLFPEIPREFLQYLQEQRGDRPGDKPFMLELAHYEWVEIALDLDEQELDAVTADPAGDLLAGIPVLSPLAWPLAYRYPVHQIRPDFQPTAPPDQPTHLVVYRNRQDEVKFMQLNPVTARLLGMLQEEAANAGADADGVKADGGRTGLVLLKAVAEELNHPDPDVVIEAGVAVLNDLAARDIILGTAP